MTMHFHNSGGTGAYTRNFGPYSTSRPAAYPATRVDVEAKFNSLVARWRFETMFTSSTGDIVRNKNFQDLVALGEPIIPLIIEEISVKPDALMLALQLITGANPVADRNRGNMPEMASDWVDWYNRTF